jgi:ATP-dependent Lon protease
MRSLERTIGGICRKVAKIQIEGKTKSINVNTTNSKEFLPSF